MIDPVRLRDTALAREAGDAALAALAARAVLRTFPAGSLLWSAGGPSRGLFLILRGRVRIVRSRDGRRRVVHTEGAGASIGEIPLFDGGGYPAAAEATEETECAVVSPDGVRAAMAAEPAVARFFLRRLSRRVRHLVERLEEASLAPIEVGVAAWLLERADGGAGQVFDLGMTQAALAEELGTVREVLVRHLTRLVRRGVLVREGRGRYRLADRRALESILRREG